MRIVCATLLMFVYINIFADDSQKHLEYKVNDTQSKKAITQITIDDIPNVQHGACFFASGEGGPLKANTELFNRIKRKSAHLSLSAVKLINKSSMPDDGSIFLVALIGSPTPKWLENLSLDLENLIHVGIKQSREYFIKKRTKNGQNKPTLIAVETGAINLVYPLILGMANGYNVYDGDVSGGRAVPEFTNSLLANSDVNDVSIMNGASKKWGTKTYFETHDTSTLQKIAEQQCMKYRQGFAIATYYMSAQQFISTTVYDDSISHALTIGRAMSDGSIENSYQLVLQKLYEIYGKNEVFKLFDGKLEDIKLYPGFHPKGYILLLDIHNSDHAMRIYFSNENLLATVGTINKGNYIEKKVVAIAPDSINYLLPHGIHHQRYYGALTLANSDIFSEGLTKLKGTEIAVIGLPSYMLRTSKGINSFKKYIDDLAPNVNTHYMPLSDLNKNPG